MSVPLQHSEDIMKGVILGVNLHDYKTELKAGALVWIDNEFYKLEKIDPSFGDVKYFVNSKINNEPMNFERNEVSKATIQIFDSRIYYGEGKQVRIGYLSPSDIRNMRAKTVFEWDLPSSEIDNIHDVDLIGHEFDGETLIKLEQDYEGITHPVAYFKVTACQ